MTRATARVLAWAVLAITLVIVGGLATFVLMFLIAGLRTDPHTPE